MPPVRLGAAHAYVPSATEGRVWLAGLDCDRPALHGVREVAVDGHVTAQSTRRVPGTWLAAAVRDGLVILRGRRLLVWDPRTGRTVRRLGLAAVAGSRGDLLLGCDARCRDLAFADAATARTVVARPPGHRRLDPSGALSPDGRLAAVPAQHGRRWSVALMGTRTGEASIVGGSRSRTYPQLAWAARPAGCSSAAAAGACSPTARVRRARSGCRCGYPGRQPTSPRAERYGPAGDRSVPRRGGGRPCPSLPSS